MTEQEINKTLAEYMGRNIGQELDGTYIDSVIFGIHGQCLYTKSLDALVPVVEKLFKETDYYLRVCIKNDGIWEINSMYGHLDSVFNKSPSLALATACYKVIKELK